MSQIEHGLVLEGEDAESFIKDMENPHVTKEQIELMKRGIEIYKRNPF